jgi:formylglycine-generating enzyme required for sulfatase activity/class 3 adenylate cyclase
LAIERVERRLTAILAADVAGYSRLVEADEEGTLTQWKGHWSAVIEPTIKRHRGRVVRVIGDGLQVEFASVIDALRCAIELQRGMRERNADVLEVKRMEFRIGINVGDIIIDGDEIFGDGVNIAARLEALARPNGICISQAVRDQVEGKLDLPMEDIGFQRLKNISSPVRVYRIDTTPGKSWRYISPYRGLAAMEEQDNDYFFGRTRETIEVLDALTASPNRLVVLIGNSGVGKSSLAQAGVIAALKRQAWPEHQGAPKQWPSRLADSGHWCFLTMRPGAEPVRSLVEVFLGTRDPDDSSAWAIRCTEWIEGLLGCKLTLHDLLDEAGRRYVELQQSEQPSFLLYVDQGEELYARAEERERGCFSELLRTGLSDERLRAIMSLRADFFGELQNDEPLHDISRKIEVPPLREAQLRELVSRPAELLGARFESDSLAAKIARRAAEDSTKDAGALPLLSYLLDDMWTQMVERGDGILRLPEGAVELGGVLVQRADAFLACNPTVENKVRRIFTLRLATVHEDGEPTRRRSFRSEFSDEEWRLVSELAGHPNRLLVVATPEIGEPYADVAHEAIFRRWDRLHEWIIAEREFLAWRSGLETARRAWQRTANVSKNSALLMGLALDQARSWLVKREGDLPGPDREFIGLSIEHDRKARARAGRVRVLLYTLLIGVMTGLVVWINQSYLKGQMDWYVTVRPYMLAQVRPHVLSAEVERELKSGDSFQECAKDCPEMIVIPAGEFTMGSAEEWRHNVTIGRPFAVAKFDVTFEQWDVCVSVGGCPQVSDRGMGRGTKPVNYVTWDEANQYVAWLSRMTGKPYRLLSESEYEYAARAGAQTIYPWGDEIGNNNANCNGCGSRWDNRETAPVGSFKPNAFGLYDVVGNVWQWVEDCAGYNKPRLDGAPGKELPGDGECARRTIRGGSWRDYPRLLRPSARSQTPMGSRFNDLGFRIARTLISGP